MRIPHKISNLIIGLGLILTISVVISGLVDAHQAASPFDQVDTSVEASKGFNPIIIPETGLVEPLRAPTLVVQTDGLQGVLKTPTPTVIIPTESDPVVVEKPLPTATAVPTWTPDRLVIPAIKLDAPVILANLKEIVYEGQTYQQWVPPDYFAAGLISSSASLGVAGNTVFIGHHNVDGEVFGHLVDLQVGDAILVYSGGKEFAYIIVLKMILPERNQPIEVRLENAKWIAPSDDERLTLVTCWPYESNTHRLIIVAMPVNLDAVRYLEVIPRITPHPPKN